MSKIKELTFVSEMDLQKDTRRLSMLAIKISLADMPVIGRILG